MIKEYLFPDNLNLFITDSLQEFETLKAKGEAVVPVLTDENRSFSWPHSEYVLENLDDIDEAYLYRIALRMNNLPVKASKDAGVRAIGLKSDEGIGEETAFLYSPKHRVMLLQQNRVGTSYVKAADYFNWFGAGINIVGFSVMMKLDAIERLKKAKSFKSLSVSFSPVNCEKELANSGVAVKHAVDMVNGLGGERLSFTISLMPRKKGTLDKVGIKSVIRKLHDFCSGGKHDVTKLQLRAEDEDGASFIDFIRDRLVCTQEVAEDEERRLSYKTRINILRNAWNSKDFQNLIVQ